MRVRTRRIRRHAAAARQYMRKGGVRGAVSVYVTLVWAITDGKGAVWVVVCGSSRMPGRPDGEQRVRARVSCQDCAAAGLSGVIAAAQAWLGCCGTHGAVSDRVGGTPLVKR